MKCLTLMLFLFGAVAAQAQNKPLLKDLLYGGKLKKDSSGIIRSTDDLSTKIDTTTKKEATAVKANAEPDKKPVSPNNANITPVAADTEDSVATIAAPVKNGLTKGNAALWKDYSDSLINTLRADVLNAKQLKKGTYYLMVDYEIEKDGQVTITKVSSTPESPFLQSHMQQAMELAPLRLNPAMDGSNQPKKVKRRQQITITKE
jgi:hypothetical protein